jgi:hypothetical protein
VREGGVGSITFDFGPRAANERLYLDIPIRGIGAERDT